MLILSPMINPIIKDPLPEQSPLIRTISTGSDEDIFFGAIIF